MGEANRYDHPNYTVVREARLQKTQGAASLTDFAHFRSRCKVLVRAVRIQLRSAPSGPSGATNVPTGGSLLVTRSQVTIAGITVSAMSMGASLGAAWQKIITLTSSNTLHTITEVIALRSKGWDQGQYDVCYEYQILPGSEFIG